MLLHDIVKKLPTNSIINLLNDVEKKCLIIRTGKSIFSLVTLPKDNFPTMTSSEYTTCFYISSSILYRLLEKTRFAISNEDALYYLNGVYLHSADSSYGKKFIRCV